MSEDLAFTLCFVALVALVGLIIVVIGNMD